MTDRRVVPLEMISVPMHDYYVLSSEDEEFCGPLTLGHITAPSPEEAARFYDDLFETRTTFRAIIPDDVITWVRMEDNE